MTRRPHKTEAATLLCRTAAHRWGARAARCHDCVGWHTSRVCHTRDGTLHLYKGCDVCERYSQRLFCFVNLLFFVLATSSGFTLSRRKAAYTASGAAAARERRCVWAPQPLSVGRTSVCAGSLFLALIYNRSNTVQSTPLLKDAPREKKHCNRTFPVQQRNFPLARLVRSPPAARADGAVLTRSGNARRARSWEATNTALALCGRRCHGCMRTRARYLPAC